MSQVIIIQNEHCPEEQISIIEKKTQNAIIIVELETYRTSKLYRFLPQNRVIFLVSGSQSGPNVFISINTAIQKAQNYLPSTEKDKVFVCGEYNILKSVDINLVNSIELFDLYDKSLLKGFSIHEKYTYNYVESSSNKDFIHYILKKDNSQEEQYLRLLQETFSGNLKNSRNGTTKSIFSKSISFNLQEGFPLLTTKKMFFRGIVEELLFFLRGDTNSKILEGKGINIWKGNTSREFLDRNGFINRQEGVMGPMYGYQWRYFGAEYDEEKQRPKEKGIDQLQDIISLIKNDPDSRRIIMTDFNPKQAKEGVLYPCHSLILQFYTRKDGDKIYLDMNCYNRSQDLFLGVPFNIASSALLLHIISKLTDKLPGILTIMMGDVHIYEEHLPLIQDQISRIPCKFPFLQISDFKNVEELTFEHFKIKDYISHFAIKAEMKA